MTDDVILPLDAEGRQVEHGADAGHALEVVQHLAAHHPHRPRVRKQFRHLVFKLN
jgi:hypothetical protein